MDAGTVRAWAAAAARALDAAREPIDSLNVFPVPDGDTGTNLALTVAEGAEHAGDPGPDATAADVAAAFARGALLGARGNSGVIVSQFLHGFARGLDEVGPTGASATDGRDGARRPADPDGALLARALDRAQEAARSAVARPVEGTILTAASAAARAAEDAASLGQHARGTASAALAAARDAVARSPQALDVLRAAGVVDAGATGLVVLLAALAEVLGAPATTDPAVLPDDRGAAAVPATEGWPAGTPHPRDDGEFEVMYVVEPHRPAPADADLGPALSARLQAIGTSVAVVGGADGWHVHVHTDDPVAAVDAGDLGERSQVVVRRLAGATAVDGLGVVAGTAAPGLVVDLARAGALVLVHAGRPVSARDVRRAVVDTGEPHVVVLPGSPAALAAAREAAGTGAAGGPEVTVLDAPDDVRVVVALTAAPGPGPGRVDAMRAALGRSRSADVEDADVAAVVACVRTLLAGGGELVTVLRGAALDAVAPGDRLLDALAGSLAGTHPDVEVVVLPGGQARPAAAVAVE